MKRLDSLTPEQEALMSVISRLMCMIAIKCVL